MTRCIVLLNPFQIALFQQQPQLRQYIRPAIERAVQELIHPVVERSIKICLTTAEMIVKKVCSCVNHQYCAYACMHTYRGGSRWEALWASASGPAHS